MHLKSRRWFDPDWPWSPRRWRGGFYGWPVAAVGILAIIASIPGQTMGISVFTESLMAATGLERQGISNAFLLGTVVSGLLLPLGGRLLDRWGARQMYVAACGLLAAALCYLAISDWLTSALATLVPLTIAGSVVLVIGFGLVRFSGQGMLTLIGRNLSGKWFDRQRGLISAISAPIIAFAFAIAPVAYLGLIGQAGWRGAWLILAALIGIGVATIGYLVARDNPEECGLRMDGVSANADPSAALHRWTVHYDYTRGEALRTVAFWAASLALATHGLVITGFTFHITAIGAEAGFSQKAIVAIFIPQAVVSVIGGIAIGIAADHVRMNVVIGCMCVAQIIGFLGSGALDTTVGWWTSVIGLGLSGACFGPLLTVTFPRWFGRAHLGAIGGVQMAVITYASAIGPSFLALVAGNGGRFGPGLTICTVLPIAVLVLVCFAKHPQDRHRPLAE